MNEPRADSSRLVAVATGLALTVAFVYYVVFVQALLLLATSFLLDANDGFGGRLTWGLFAALATAGCLLAGWWIDRRSPSARTLLMVAAACSLYEGAAGLTWIFLTPTVLPPLGLFLGAHIVCLLALLNTALGARVRVSVAAWSLAAIYLLANAVVLLHSTAPIGLAVSPMDAGWSTGMLSLAAVPIILLLALLARVEPPKDIVRAEPRSLPFARALPWAVFVIVAIDVASFASVFQLPELVPSEGAIALNGALHALGVIPAVLLLRWKGPWAALAGAAASWIAFVILPIAGASKLYPLAAYSLFVPCYTIVLFTMWPYLWSEGRRGRTIAMGMLVCGFGGSAAGMLLRWIVEPLLTGLFIAAYPWN